MFSLLALNTPVIQPKVPFVIQIPKLTPGWLLNIDGSIPSTGIIRFEVNLAMGPKFNDSNLSDIAFHFNPRFKHNYVARNTLVKNSWGDEESKNPSDNPFKIGKDFEIMILVEPHQYKVAVNGKHFLAYNHRVPMEDVTTLQIFGDVLLKKVEITHTLCNSVTPQQNAIGPSEHLEYLNPAVPFNFFLPNGFVVNDTLYLTAKPTMFPNSFSINLKTLNNRLVLLHFNPRFSGDDANIVVRNSCSEDWETEERDGPSFPFHPGTTFDLQLKCEEKEFLIAVNGKHFVNYRYRYPLEKATVFAITGDIQIDCVKLN